MAKEGKKQEEHKGQKEKERKVQEKRGEKGRSKGIVGEVQERLGDLRDRIT